MKVVYKYDLSATGAETVIRLPVGAIVRHVGEQHGWVKLWVEVDPAAPTGDRRFLTVGTGYPVPAGAVTFVGTVITHGGKYVWHVYEADSAQAVERAS